MINKTILHACHKEGISEKELYGAYKIFFGTLVSEPRLKIINFLRTGKRNVTEIMEELHLDQTAVSHNLRRLKQCGFVKIQVSGKYRYYFLNKETIDPLMTIIEKHMKSYCVHILRATEKMKGGHEHERR